MSSPLQAEIQSIQLYNYVSLAIFTVMVHDYVITFSNEIEYIWNKPWTWVSTLFILIRYAGFFSILTYCFVITSFLGSGPTGTMNCNTMELLHHWAYAFFLGAADAVMILRTWAMYNRSRAILITLLTLYVVEMVLIILAYSLESDTKDYSLQAFQTLGFSSCSTVYSSPLAHVWTWGFMITHMIHGGVSCLLISVQFVRQSLQMYHARKQWQLNRYMTLLIRQGILYFVAFFVFDLISLLGQVGITPQDEWPTILWFIAELVPVFILTPRFTLSIRELYAYNLQCGHGHGIDTGFGLSDGSGISAHCLTTIEFGDVMENKEDQDANNAESTEMGTMMTRGPA